MKDLGDILYFGDQDLQRQIQKDVRIVTEDVHGGGAEEVQHRELKEETCSLQIWYLSLQEDVAKQSKEIERMSKTNEEPQAFYACGFKNF